MILGIYVDFIMPFFFLSVHGLLNLDLCVMDRFIVCVCVFFFLNNVLIFVINYLFICHP
jgi:hypothetical protein